jgi:hypothetical protein
MTQLERIILRGNQLKIAEDPTVKQLDDGRVLIENGFSGFALYGPYIAVPNGQYQVDVKLSGKKAASGRFEIYSSGEILGSTNSIESTRFESYIKNAYELEFRVYVDKGSFIFDSVEISKIGELIEDTYFPDLDILNQSRLRLVRGSAESDLSANPAAIPASPESPAGQLWRALHSRCGREVLASIARSARAAGLAEWVSATSNATVVEAWGTAGLASNKRLLDLGLHPVAVRLAASEELALEAAFAAERGDTATDEALRDIAIRDLGRKVGSPYLAKLSEMQSASQTGALRSGFMTCPCPFTGEILQSQHCFPIAFDKGKQTFLFYRFESVEPFYVIHGGWTGAKIAIYIPTRELILRLQDPHYNWGPPQDAVNEFKTLILEHAETCYDYLLQPTKLALVSGTIDNLGHFFWNDLSGIVKMERAGLLDRVDNVLTYKFNFIEPFEVLDRYDKLTKLAARTATELLLAAVQNHLFCVRATSLFIDDDTAGRTEQIARRHATAATLENIHEAKQCERIIWINLRSHNKVLVNTVDCCELVLRRLSTRYRSVAVFFDGTPDCRELMSEIVLRLPQNVRPYDGLSLSVYDSIVWAFSVDYYIATIGSGLTLVTWLAQRPGVAHSERAHLAQMEFWGDVRPGAPRPVVPATEDITDLGKGGYCDYTIEPDRLVGLLEDVIAKNEP